VLAEKFLHQAEEEKTAKWEKLQLFRGL
jgi:hypothetical protein